MQQYNTDIERVVYLIDSYRDEIGGKNSKNAKAIQNYYDAEEKRINESIAKRKEKGEDISNFYIEIETPSELENKIKTNEQLLGHFYSKAAGSMADKGVLSQLLANVYDDTYFSDEEESFLLSHFTEMVNYIIKTSSCEFKEYDDLKDAHLLPSEVLELIVKIFDIPQNSVVYNPFTGLAQLAIAYKHNHFICEESYSVGNDRNCTDYSNWLWAWMRVALYANNIDVEDVNDILPSSYDVVLSYIPLTSINFFREPNDDTLYSLRNRYCDPTIVKKLTIAYENLNENGKMLLILPDFLFINDEVNSPFKQLWEQVIKENSLSQIIQLPSTCNGLNYCFCILVIDKGHQCGSVSMIDARFATKKNSDSSIINLEDFLDIWINSIMENEKNSSVSPPSTRSFRKVYIEGEEKMVEEFETTFYQTIDVNLIYKMMQNKGIDPKTGSREMVNVNNDKLNLNLLLPQIYTIEKPQERENSIPLSKLCFYVSDCIKKLKVDVSADTPWVKEKNLDYVCNGPLNIQEVEKAGCPSNPPRSKDYIFDKSGKLSEEYPWSQRTPMGRRVVEFRKCTYLDGTKDAVLMKIDSDGIRLAIITKGVKPIAVGYGIYVFCPNDGVQVYTLAAILKMPIVYRQIQVYEKFGLSNYLDTIIVPYDKWLIDNEVSRVLNEKKTYNRYKEDYESIKRSVRMRKHALTQSLSSIEAMFYALNAYRNRNGGNIVDGDVISRIKGTTVGDAFEFLGKSINDMRPALEHIAEVEYTFADPDWIDPEVFIENYISKNEKGWINFKPSVTWDKGNNLAKNDLRDPLTGKIIIRKGEAQRLFSFPKDALEKVFDNIISNAQSHGFKNNPRKDLEIKFSWHTDGMSLIVEVENNGLPISANCDTASLLEYGVSTMLHQDGHNGIGCNEIDNIMRRYDSKVKIVSNPKHEFTVKYILMFNRSNFG